MTLQLTAPAKINWTLEVLGKRADGYHEICSIVQTVQLADYMRLWPADELSLSVRGATRGFRRASRESPESNLVYRAARLLQERTGTRAGARIYLSKRISIAAGLGGGSSDAAAALRALRKLWNLDMSDDELMTIGAELGSDVPFFIRGGTALVSGRGEIIEPLPDIQPRYVFLVFPDLEPSLDKTATMYATLRSEHYTDGTWTAALAERIRTGDPPLDRDLSNVFEAVLPEVDPDAAELLERAATLGFGRPHLCGSGPALFFLLAPDQTAEPRLRALEGLGLHTIETRTLPAAEAVAFEEQP